MNNPVLIVLVIQIQYFEDIYLHLKKKQVQTSLVKNVFDLFEIESFLKFEVPPKSRNILIEQE